MARKQKQELIPKSEKWELMAAYSILRGWATADFFRAWEMWIAHRREMRKPMTETAVRLQLEQLKKGTPEDAVAAIEHSIASGYRGIFPAPHRAAPTTQKVLGGIKEFLE